MVVQITLARIKTINYLLRHTASTKKMGLHKMYQTRKKVAFQQSDSQKMSEKIEKLK
jgi:hypothetical protein